MTGVGSADQDAGTALRVTGDSLVSSGRGEGAAPKDRKTTRVLWRMMLGNGPEEMHLSLFAQQGC